jgi:hypothetical protein
MDTLHEMLRNMRTAIEAQLTNIAADTPASAVRPFLFEQIDRLNWAQTIIDSYLDKPQVPDALYETRSSHACRNHWGQAWQRHNRLVT